MKIFILFLVLIFSLQSFAKADDVRDFEIEGMSVGDSMLDYATRSYILDELEEAYTYPKSKKYKIIYIKPDNSELYDHINIGIKSKDPKFIIHSINAFVKKELDDCLKIKKETVKSISNILPNSKKRSYENDYAKAYGSSIAYVDHFDLENGVIRTWCDVWDENLETNWEDSLNVAAENSEWINFLDNEAY